MIFHWSKGIASRPIKYGGKLLWQMGDKLFWANLLGDCSTWMVNGLIIVREGSFTNAFSSNLKTENFKTFASHDAVYLNINP